MRCHQASAVSRVRKASCFPLRAGFACSVVPALPLLSPSGRVAQGAERGQFKFLPFFQALSLLIFLAKKFAKMFSHFVASPCLHKIFSHYAPSPCLIVLAHNETKIVSLVPRLPLACIKFCLQNFLRQKCEALPYVKASPWGEAPCEARW